MIKKTKKNKTHKKIHLPKYRTITNKNELNIRSNKSHTYITSEVLDDASYTHFKSLIEKSHHLCKGQTQSGKKYKIRKSILKDMNALKKDNHYDLSFFFEIAVNIAFQDSLSDRLISFVASIVSFLNK